MNAVELLSKCSILPDNNHDFLHGYFATAATEDTLYTCTMFGCASDRMIDASFLKVALPSSLFRFDRLSTNSLPLVVSCRSEFQTKRGEGGDEREGRTVRRQGRLTYQDSEVAGIDKVLMRIWCAPGGSRTTAFTEPCRFCTVLDLSHEKVQREGNRRTDPGPHTVPRRKKLSSPRESNPGLEISMTASSAIHVQTPKGSIPSIRPHELRNASRV